MGWALGRDGNNSFLIPDTWDIQVLYWSFMSLCTLYMPIHIRINCIINAFFLYWTSLNFFACLCWLAPTLLTKLPVNFYTFQKEFGLASSNLFQSELKNAKVSFKRHFNSVISLVLLNFVHTHLPWIIYPSGWVTGRRWGTRRRPRNQLTRIIFMAPINIQMVAMDI